MSRHEEMCPHCRAKKAGQDEAAPLPESITAQPTDAPRTFRIHYPDGHTRDYTIHPDSQLTMTFAGQRFSTSLTFEDMAATSWAGAHVEWDPQPQEAVTDTSSAAADPASIQEAFPAAA